jgi:hypothetical protein
MVDLILGKEQVSSCGVIPEIHVVSNLEKLDKHSSFLLRALSII